MFMAVLIITTKNIHKEDDQERLRHASVTHHQTSQWPLQVVVGASPSGGEEGGEKAKGGGGGWKMPSDPLSESTLAYLLFTG